MCKSCLSIIQIPANLFHDSLRVGTIADDEGWHPVLEVLDDQGVKCILLFFAFGSMGVFFSVWLKHLTTLPLSLKAGWLRREWVNGQNN